VRHGGTVRRRIREDAPGAGAQGGVRTAASRSTGFKGDHLFCSAISPCLQDLTAAGRGIFSAKPQRREGAKSFLRLGDFAAWRLCVEKSFLSVKSAKFVVQLLWRRLPAQQGKKCQIRSVAATHRGTVKPNQAKSKYSSMFSAPHDG